MKAYPISFSTPGHKSPKKHFWKWFALILLLLLAGTCTAYKFFKKSSPENLTFSIGGRCHEFDFLDNDKVDLTIDDHTEQGTYSIRKRNNQVRIIAVFTGNRQFGFRQNNDGEWEMTGQRNAIPCEDAPQPPLPTILTINYSPHGTLRAPVNLHFSSDAAISATEYRWDFGDGEHSTLRSPTHNYLQEGTYTVMLTVDNITSTTLNIQISEPLNRINITDLTMTFPNNSIDTPDPIIEILSIAEPSNTYKLTPVEDTYTIEEHRIDKTFNIKGGLEIRIQEDNSIEILGKRIERFHPKGSIRITRGDLVRRLSQGSTFVDLAGENGITGRLYFNSNIQNTSEDAVFPD